MAVVQVEDRHLAAPSSRILVGQLDVDTGIRHLAGRENDEVGVDRRVLVQDQVAKIHVAEPLPADSTFDTLAFVNVTPLRCALR